jgi:L-ascorbate metabolism protein UlaG (beta-lactamase superfamily)
MKKYLLCPIFFVIAFPLFISAQNQDIIKTDAGDLGITLIGHASLMFNFSGKVIHIDPVFQQADYNKMPKADLILVTHDHGDHLDANAINILSKQNTEIVLTELCAQKVKSGIVMKNGDVKTVAGLKVEAIPAYNIVNKQNNGLPYHAKGDGNGYIITFGNKLVYVAGDTENTPEMKNLKNIEVAFLPMNLPYTMTPAMVADAVKAFKPKILYPYHIDTTFTPELLKLLEGEKGLQIRVNGITAVHQAEKLTITWSGIKKP